MTKGVDRFRAALRSLREGPVPSPLSLWEVWMVDRANRLEARLLRVELFILAVVLVDAVLATALFWVLR
jgi:hypothetical protein